jgi:hypothetical protein
MRRLIEEERGNCAAEKSREFKDVMGVGSKYANGSLFSSNYNLLQGNNDTLAGAKSEKKYFR